jgi:hypothetical protein
LKFKQFAALPFRMRHNDLEILPITTRKRCRWSVPKGWPIRRSTPQRIAALEAYEEAGVQGITGAKQIGRFQKRKKGKSVQCEVEIFPLEVKRQQTDWLEKAERSRMWVDPQRALKLVKKQGLRRAIKQFGGRQP